MVDTVESFTEITEDGDGVITFCETSYFFHEGDYSIDCTFVFSETKL